MKKYSYSISMWNFKLHQDNFRNGWKMKTLGIIKQIKDLWVGKIILIILLKLYT